MTYRLEWRLVGRASRLLDNGEIDEPLPDRTSALQALNAFLLRRPGPQRSRGLLVGTAVGRCRSRSPGCPTASRIADESSTRSAQARCEPGSQFGPAIEASHPKRRGE